MRTDELREKYLAFFETKGHVRRPSDVLVPTWDPSVLFTPAGMNQFKDHFLGRVKLDFTRATTCQKCLRTGDIDNVGRTAYHHTFFEMLGNFSFGDYFKREAILWAWEFLTDRKWLGLPPERLSATVYLDDDEAAEIWTRDVGLPPEKVERMGEDENFWPTNAPSQGPDGVCGPCSEIYFHPPRGKPVEIWNLVFTQFNRVGDPPDNLRPLPKKNIDTGMGLERTAAVLQGVDSNFHIDILRPIVEAAAEVCGIAYEPGSDAGRRLRRITDHVRACVFAIHENVYPGPNKEKYVVRRLLRRAILDGYQLGAREPFLYRLTPAVVEQMKQPYPELLETAGRVAGVVRQEEEGFLATIDRGIARIESLLEATRTSGGVVVEGEKAFDLYQTYGTPPELIETLAQERQLTFDWEGFREAVRRGAGDTTIDAAVFKEGAVERIKAAVHATEFLGYETTAAEARVRGIVLDPTGNAREQKAVEALRQTGPEHRAIVVLDRTPFYGEAGGQVGDTGEIVGPDFRFVVTDAQRDGEVILHRGYLAEGEMHAGAAVTARVTETRRAAIRRAHSATHLLHYALRKHLGQHAQQQGSKVDEDWLRFDFTHLSPVAPEQLAAIEADVVRQIDAAEPVAWQILPLAEARKAGAMMLFGEKYPDPVRMVSMGGFSRELCGGTHLENTAQVEAFDLLSEEGISAGTRRIVALTGAKAREHMQKARAALQEAAAMLGVWPVQVPDALRMLAQHVRDLKKELSGSGKAPPAAPPPEPPAGDAEPSYAEVKAALREAARILNVAPFDVPARLEALVREAGELRRQLTERAAAGTLTSDELLAAAEDVGGVKLVAAEAPGSNPNLMRQLIDQCRKKAPPCMVLLATAQGADKVTLVAGVTHDLVARGVHAGNWVRETAQLVGGGGGGKPDMAQAGGKEPQRLPEALQAAREMARKALAEAAAR